MMQSGMKADQRDIVLLPFPFTDLTGTKRRPALILSGKNYNSKNKDRICCALTSNPERFGDGITINNGDLDSGHLDLDSVIIPCKIFTIHTKIIAKTKGRLKIERSKAVVNFLNLNIEIEE